MPPPHPTTHGAAARLIKDYETYDQAVDIVSAFEFIFTIPDDMRATVSHFERFPKIQTPAGTVTPDFTVCFTDNTALVGEISRLSLRDKSVESACAQIGRYDALTHVHDSTGHLTKVTDVSVLQLVPLDVGPDAVERIIRERMLNDTHPYKPTKAPCIAQYARDPDRYMFQRIYDPDNGTINGHNREPHLGARIRQLNIPASGFTGIKSNRKFMNDPIPPLYLAVVLYTQTWPTLLRGRSKSIVVTPRKTAATLRSQYGAGNADDVRHALTLLVSAGLAADNKDGTWNVYAKPPRLKGEHDLARVIAQRSADQARPVITSDRARKAAQTEQQDTLF